MKPTVGRIVHYGYCPSICVSDGKGYSTKVEPMELAAAIITKVTPRPGVEKECNHHTEAFYDVRLRIFAADGIAVFDDGKPVEYAEKLEAGKWTWPPRE